MIAENTVTRAKKFKPKNRNTRKCDTSAIPQQIKAGYWSSKTKGAVHFNKMKTEL